MRSNQRFSKARAAARKAARTAKVRREFVQRFGTETLNALAHIVQGRPTITTVGRRSMAAYKANLTRGVYSDFVTVDTNGNVKTDVLGLNRI